MTWSAPHTFSYSEVLTSANLNSNFAILNEMAAAKFSAKGQFLAATGANAGAVVPVTSVPNYWIPRRDTAKTMGMAFAHARSILKYVETPAEVVSTSAETDIFNISIPGSTLAAKGCLVWEAFVIYVNNSGAPRDLTLKLYLAGSSVSFTQTIAVVAAGAPSLLKAYIAPRNSTSVQDVYIGKGSSAETFGNFAIDMTATQTFRITAQHSASSASLSLKCIAPTLYLIPSNA